jgi:predicted secreted protein
MFFSLIRIFAPQVLARLFLSTCLLSCASVSHSQITDAKIDAKNKNANAIEEMLPDMIKADTLDKVLALFKPAINKTQIVASDYLLLDSPQIAPAGLLSVHLMSELPGTELFLLFNSRPATDEPSFLAAQAVPNLGKLDKRIKIKLSKTSDLLFIVRAGGRWYSVSNEVKIATK